MKTAKCHRCSGKGHHVDPKWEMPGGGITASEMEEILRDDPDFIDFYLSDESNMTCQLCDGSGILSMEPEDVEQRMWDAEIEMERMIESRMLGEY